MSDLTPNHKAGEPLEAIDADKLASLRQKNIETQKAARRSSRLTPRLMDTSAITLRFAT